MGLFKKKNQEPKQPQLKPAVMTVYANRKSYDEVHDIMADILKGTLLDKTLTDDGVEYTLQDGSKMTLHFMPKTQIANHITGMEAFFLKAPVENETLKKSLVQQMIYFNAVVGIEFLVNDIKERTEYLIASVYMLAVKLEGFVLHPNMFLFRYDRKLLISVDGQSDFTEYTPVGESTFLDKDIPEGQGDIDRRLRSIEKCKEKGLPYMETLKASVYEEECVIPSKENIIHRAACIFAAAVCAEACYTEPKKAKSMCGGMLEELEKRYGVSQFFSDEEKSYVGDPMKFPNLHTKFSWRYEGCAVLLWAIGLWELGDPISVCDAGELGKIIWNNDFDSLNEKAVLKSKTEILDMQDLMLRYDWACVDARINNKKVTAVNDEIVVEWHYALNWLTNANYTDEWDEIRTDT